MIKIDGNPNNILFVASVLHRAGQHDKALAMLDKLITSGENDAEIYLQYCDILMESLDIDSAFEFIHRGLFIHPNHAGLLFRKSLVCNILGDDEAFVYFEQALIKNDILDLRDFFDKYPEFISLDEAHDLLKKYGFLDRDNFLIL